MKHCSGCEKDKEVGEFPIDRSRNDGHGAYCKSCKKIIRRSYYEKYMQMEKSRSMKWNSENKQRYNDNHKRFVEKNVDYRFSVMKAAAKRRGIIFDLDFSEYLPLTLLPCHYCGDSLPRRGGGLDRVDNNKGYSVDNIVPCCQYCNQAKMNQTQSEFIARCVRIAEKHNRQPSKQTERQIESI